MPIYQYHCRSCGRDLEIFQHMTDPTLTVCPECQGPIRKIFSPVGIVFKGSGFYATDSKQGSSSTTSLPAGPTAPASDTTAPTTTTSEATAPAGAATTSAPASPSPAPAPAAPTAAKAD